MNHEYAMPAESVRLALVLGIACSMLVYERWRLTGGGVVVSGYLATFVSRPVFIATTLVVAVATYLLVQHVIAQRVFLYGRRRLVVMVLVGLGLQMATGWGARVGHWSQPWLIGLFGIGFVLPGLIAQDMKRQGPALTMLVVAGTALLTALCLHGLLTVAQALWPYSPPASFHEFGLTYAYPIRMIYLAVTMSILLSAFLFERWSVRSGGFVTAGYAALFVLQPLNLVFLVAMAVLVYVFMTRLLMPYTPVFGRTKFAMTILSSVVLMWLGELLVVTATHGDFVPISGFAVIGPMIAALIANDGERQGLGKTLLAVAACTSVVFVAMSAVARVGWLQL